MDGGNGAKLLFHYEFGPKDSVLQKSALMRPQDVWLWKYERLAHVVAANFYRQGILDATWEWSLAYSFMGIDIRR